MVHVNFDTVYHRDTNNLSQIEVEGPITLKELLLRVLSLFPQLYVRLQEDPELGSRTLVVLNDETLLGYSDRSLLISSGDQVAFLEAPYGSGEAVVMALEFYFEVALPEVVSAILAIAVNILAVTAVGAILTAIMGSLNGDVTSPDAGMGVNNSPTYTFDGVKNTSYSGAPVLITYGQHRVGGNILNVYVKDGYSDVSGTTYLTSATSQGSYIVSELYTQIGLGEGEIESVSDVWVNKQPLNFFNGVSTLAVRVGLAQQDLMLDFSRIETTLSDNRKLLCLYDSSGKRVDFSDQSNDSMFASILSTATPVCGVIERTKSWYNITLGNYKL